MTMQELLQFSAEELTSKLEQARHALFTAREHIQQGKEKNYAQLKAMRAEVARTATALQAKKAE